MLITAKVNGVVWSWDIETLIRKHHKFTPSDKIEDLRYGTGGLLPATDQRQPATVEEAKGDEYEDQ